MDVPVSTIQSFFQPAIAERDLLTFLQGDGRHCPQPATSRSQVIPVAFGSQQSGSKWATSTQQKPRPEKGSLQMPSWVNNGTLLPYLVFLMQLIEYV